MSRKPLLILALLLSAALFAACGGDDEGNGNGGGGEAPSPEEYSQRVSDQMAQFGRDFAQEFRALGETAATPENVEEYVDAIEAMQGHLVDTADTLEGIEPPAEAEDIHPRLTQAFRDLEGAYGGIVEAVRSEDRQRVTDAVSEMQTATQEFLAEVNDIAAESQEAGVPIENLASRSAD